MAGAHLVVGEGGDGRSRRKKRKLLTCMHGAVCCGKFKLKLEQSRVVRVLKDDDLVLFHLWILTLALAGAWRWGEWMMSSTMCFLN